MEERDNGIFDIEATIVCERESHKGIVIGKGGSMLKKIGTAARIEIENLMDAKVNLQRWVKVRREWRDSELYMKNYGHNPRDIQIVMREQISVTGMVLKWPLRWGI